MSHSERQALNPEAIVDSSCSTTPRKIEPTFQFVTKIGHKLDVILVLMASGPNPSMRPMQTRKMMKDIGALQNDMT